MSDERVSTSPSGRKRVLVVYKKSAYQVYVRERKNERIEGLIRDGNPAVSRLMKAHDDHAKAMEGARLALEKLGVKPVFRYRSDANTSDKFDLVITLGGDGTLLWASHYVGAQTPMVAINTAPENSVGYYAAGTRFALDEVFADALAGRLSETLLTRMEVRKDGAVVSSRVLNDALFCHECPAATTRYTLRIGEVEEEQKSSGLWIGPAAGSTAAIKSAGGKPMAITSKKLQMVVREPYEAPGVRYSLRRAFIGPNETLTVLNRTRSGRLYIDGQHRAHDLEIGNVLSFKRSPESLTLLGFSRRK